MQSLSAGLQANASAEAAASVISAVEEGDAKGAGAALLAGSAGGLAAANAVASATVAAAQQNRQVRGVRHAWCLRLVPCGMQQDLSVSCMHAGPLACTLPCLSSRTDA